MGSALEVSRQMLTIAEGLEDAQLICRAHMMLSEVYFEVGEFHRAVHHGRAGVRLYETERHRTDLVRFGNDSEVGCLLFMALGLWSLGHPDQAANTSGTALSKARALAHPFTLVFSLFFNGFVFMLRREADRALACVRELLREATTHGFSVYRKCGPALEAWAIAEQGRPREALPVMEGYLNDPLAPKIFRPHFLAALATCYARIGRIDDGIACLTQGLAGLSESNARGWEAELFRLRGELSRLGGLSADSAATDYAKALQVARRQEAKALELRAATSTARLLADQGSRDRARAVLSGVYAGFREGFDTADLREASELFAGLGEGG
jgi:tetratricopeptide (TPR) repeat protein